MIFPLSVRLVVALVIAAAMLPTAPVGAQKAGKKGGESVSVIVSEARSVALSDRIEGLGTARANESVRISSKVTNKVAALHFDDGQVVEKGDLLVVLNKAEEEANLRAMKALMAERELAFARVERLADRQVAAKAQLDERRAALLQMRAQIEAVEARIAELEIRAPFGGIMGMRDVSVGALIEPGDHLGMLDDISVIKLDFSVPSIYLASLRPGLEVQATTTAYGDRVFRGAVKSVDSRVDPVTRSVVVRALVDNPDVLLKPGMLMTVLCLHNLRRAIVVPESALVPHGKTQHVLVVDRKNDNRVEQREVRIGARRAGDVEILSGVAEGEAVITHGTMAAKPGRSVVIRAVDDGRKGMRDMINGKSEAGTAR